MRQTKPSRANYEHLRNTLKTHNLGTRQEHTPAIIQHWHKDKQTKPAASGASTFFFLKEHVRNTLKTHWEHIGNTLQRERH
jgi:hypothetical protein